MRTLVLIIVMLVVVGGGFYFIALRDRPGMVAGPIGTTQPDGSGAAAAHRKPIMVPASMPANQPNASVVGQSSGVFLESRDPRTGRITHKLRAESLDPHRDGTVGVIKPEVRFYGKDRGGVIVLEGSGGTVKTSSGGNPDDPKSLGTQTPESGELNDVVVRVYNEPSDPALAADEEKLLKTTADTTIYLPAAKYDAVAGRVMTADGVVNGKSVPAERMPVTVRGRDFELDGQGLTLQWNDRTGKLDSLVIERGDRLLLLNTAKFGGPSLLSYAPSLQPAEPVASVSPMAFSFPDLFDGLVAAPTTAPGMTPATAPSVRKPADLYNATFDHDVVILRGSTQIGAADVMQVALTFGGDGDDQSVAAPPAPAAAVDDRPETKAAKRRADEALAEKRRVAAENRAKESGTSPVPSRPKAVAAAPATLPSTAPADPVEVHWSGKLTVRPAAAVPNPPTAQMVELTGVPAWVKQNGAEARGASIRIEPKSGKLRVSPSAAVPTIQVKGADGGSLTSTSLLDVDREGGAIDVTGPGTMDVPPGAGPTLGGATSKPAESVAPTTAPAATQPTTVRWTRRMHVDLADIAAPAGNAPAKPQQYLKQITIEGDADVKSPTMAAQAQTLSLAFAPPAASAASPAKSGGGDADGFAMFKPDFTHLRLVQPRALRTW